MSELLDAIGGALDAASLGVLGTDIFLSRAPSTPDECFVVYETGAGYPIYTQGSTNTARLNVANVQVVCRAGREDYETARTNLTAVVTALETLSESTIDGIRILRVEQVGAIAPLGFDDNERPRVAGTFAVTYED